jgi:phenylalanyl-tRNA synthetase beta chain
MSLREVLKYTDKGREYGFIIEGMPKFPVIADSEGRILSLAPILNSEDAKVTTSTKNILVDSTGLDPRIVVDMATIVAFNLYERGSATELCIVKTVYENGTVLVAPRLEGVIQEISLKEVNELVGANITVEDAIRLLKQFGYKVLSVRDGGITAQAPPYRVDVLSWVDVAEDIAIAYGYDKLGEEASELPPATRGGRENPVEHFSYFLRSIMVSMGFSEVANYMMTNTNLDVNLFGRRVEPILVANPISERFTSIRTWLTPGLLGVIVENKNKASDFKVFEVGDVAYVKDGRVIEERRIGLAVSNYNATLTDGLAAVKTLLNTLGVSPRFTEGSVEGLLKERTALILIGDEVVGLVGEIHPEILYKLNYDRPVVVAEINIGKLLKTLEKH